MEQIDLGKINSEIQIRVRVGLSLIRYHFGEKAMILYDKIVLKL